MGREHTNRDYEQELRKLREQILLMGAKVEESITGSIRALTERDTRDFLASERIDHRQTLRRAQPTAGNEELWGRAFHTVNELVRRTWCKLRGFVGAVGKDARALAKRGSHRMNGDCSKR